MQTLQLIVHSFECDYRGHKVVFKLRAEEKYRCGAYGLVSVYTALGKNKAVYQLCVKHTNDVEEIKQVLRQEKKQLYCGQVEAKMLCLSRTDLPYHRNMDIVARNRTIEMKHTKNPYLYAYVMPKYTGTLEDFEFKQAFTKKTLIRIIEDLKQQLDCLQVRGGGCVIWI